MTTAEDERETLTPEEPANCLRGRPGKEVLLRQAGAFEDDADDLAALRAAIYRDRGRSEAEEVGRLTSPQTTDNRPWISIRKEE